MKGEKAMSNVSGVNNGVFRLIVVLAVFLTQCAFVLPDYTSSATNTRQEIQLFNQGSTSGGEEQIDKFYAYNWSLVNSIFSCRDISKGCWVYVNYKSKGWLMGQQSVYIDPTWKSPQLVFWTKYYSKRLVNYAHVEVQVEGDTRWDRLKTFGGTRNWWSEMSIDLSAYSGKKIFIKFFVEPNQIPYRYAERSRKYASYYNKQLFYVNDVRILPEKPAE
jgi:hypothetical protein